MACAHPTVNTGKHCAQARAASIDPLWAGPLESSLFIGQHWATSVSSHQSLVEICASINVQGTPWPEDGNPQEVVQPILVAS